MIGIIVTGHGEFASGLTSGLKLLAGETECYEAVDFKAEDSTELLTENLRSAIQRLKDCEAVAVLADLTGGSPFNMASRLKMSGIHENMEVVGGISLPLVLHAYMSRAMFSDIRELLDASLEMGKQHMMYFQTSDEACELEE
uniref:PTS sugar transporter subunit IIA domain-containing protein n=1 Tax=Clostridium sp. NkU-1 TaxID=1095009 RepID=UPI0006CF2B99